MIRVSAPGWATAAPEHAWAQVMEQAWGAAGAGCSSVHADPWHSGLSQDVMADAGMSHEAKLAAVG